MAWMLVTITLGDETLDGLTNQLRPQVAEQFFGLDIHQCDRTVLVYNHHRVRRGFQEISTFIIHFLLWHVIPFPGHEYAHSTTVQLSRATRILSSSASSPNGFDRDSSAPALNA
jgi:hypothetical protein